MTNDTAAVHAVVAATSAAAARAQAKCRGHHTGPWAVEPDWFAKTVDAINRGTLKPRGDTVDPDDDDDDGDTAVGPYRTVNGIAVIPIAGAMMKARSKFGGTSTVDVRNAVRSAAADGNVKAILLHVDSPGGTVAGTDALAQDVAAADQQKPVYAHVEDMGASAAYWVASQARRLTASRGSLVGSLGTRMSVVDSSAAAAADGYRVLSFATGEFKAAGLDGTPVTDRQAAYFQQTVNDANAHFQAAVAAGRGLGPDQIAALFDGRVHDAATAKSLGLVDDVSTLDAAVAAILTEVSNMTSADFKSFAAANPTDQAVADVQFQARTEGREAGEGEALKIERKRAADIIAACGTDHALAVKFIATGQTAEAAKIAADAVAERTVKAETKVDATATFVAGKDAEINRLNGQIEFLQSGQAAVPNRSGGTPTPTPTATAATDPEAKAKGEWAAMSADDQSAWLNQDAYVGYRKAEMKGQIQGR